MEPLTVVPDLSIVLVCWNNRAYMESCLESLFIADLPFTTEIVAVDNGSADGSLEMLAEDYPAVRVIRNQTNVGLSCASNQGIESTSGRYVLLLNNDTLVNSTLAHLVEFLDEHPEAGAAGGKLLNPDGSLQATFADFSSLWQEFLIATGLGRTFWPNYPDHQMVNAPRPVDWVSSACLMLRRVSVEQVGELDEQYFIYGDEVDLCYRLKQAGWRVYFLPEVHTVHFGGRSMNRWSRRRMVYRGKILFYHKNYGPAATATFRLMLALLTVPKLVFWMVTTAFRYHREQAAKEIQSNLDVLRLCVGFS